MDLNLYELLRDNKKPFDEKTSLLLIYQLLKALNNIHSKNLFHRDIKPENCMVNKSTFELKLCDFGSTRLASSNGPFTEYVSTRWYRAPECILTSGSYGSEVDIWAVGCMLYELMTTKPLFPGKHEIDQITRIHSIVGTPSRDLLTKFKQNPNTQISFAFPQKNPQDFHSLLPDISENTIDLIENLLIYNPSDRISAENALNHHCFDYIRYVENKWIELGSKGIFSEYYLHSNIIYPSTFGGGFILDKNLIEDKNLDNKSFFIQTKPNIPQPLPKQNHQPIIAPQIISKMNKNQNSIDFNSLDARLKAAARIREYNQKKILNQQKKSIVPQFQFNQYSISKENYQKPHPDLIQPRLPKLK